MRIPTLFVLAISLLLLSGCTNVFFQPMKPLARTPKDINLEYRDVYFKAADDTRLHGWFLPAAKPAKASVLFFHGNAENISTHIGSVFWLPQHGINVFLVDYRGYGNSEKTPELHGVYRDASAALDRFMQFDEITDTRLVVFGQSLGGAIALHTIAHSKHKDSIDAVIIESTFTSYRDIARDKLGELWLTWPFQWPLSLLISDRYKPIEAAPLISPTPLHFIHSQKDRVIPFTHSETLYQAAHQPKTIWIAPQGGHNGLVRQPEYRERLLNYILDVDPQQKRLTHSASPSIAKDN